VAEGRNVNDGLLLGLEEGIFVGFLVGFNVGEVLGIEDGELVGLAVGRFVGFCQSNLCEQYKSIQFSELTFFLHSLDDS
jgi:hypothetical protein